MVREHRGEYPPCSLRSSRLTQKHPACLNYPTSGCCDLAFRTTNTVVLIADVLIESVPGSDDKSPLRRLGSG